MSRWNNNILSIIVYAAIFILLEVAAVAMLKISSSLQDVWFTRFNHSVLSFVWGGSEKIRGLFTLKEENEMLARQNLELVKEIKMLKESGEPVPSDDSFLYIPAHISKMSRNSQHNYIIIDKGSEDGIVPNSGIITSLGVVGIISAVDKHHSYGLTFMNSKVSVSARIGRNGSISPLVWDGKHVNKANMINLPAHVDVTPGDTVYTSGFSSIFPPDIPLGIAGSSKIVDGSSNTVEIFLFQDFSSLRSVTAVVNPGKEEIDALISDAEEEL